MAMAARMPECMIQNIAQPHRNPSTGPYVSLRKTYTPPLRGNAADSSAATSAPNNVSSPAASHAAMMPGTDGTRAVITDGCTKIDAPMIVPTTIAVAGTRPSTGRSGWLLGLFTGDTFLFHSGDLLMPRLFAPLSILAFVAAPLAAQQQPYVDQLPAQGRPIDIAATAGRRQ